MVTPRVVALKADLDRLVAAGRDDDLGPALEQARRAFLRAGPELLNAATPYLWQYYAATSAEGGGPLIGGSEDIWDHVGVAHPPEVRAGSGPLEPAAAYLSFEGEVSWEPEHGLQLVFEEGSAVGKVGPYDGHVTQAHAYGDAALLGVVYR